ncbi:MAG: hypothetical protein KIT09_10175 [Bryobacteraceae bacterium]|nr:hypothetical protein [Bryobacteraceae bacterium]
MRKTVIAITVAIPPLVVMAHLDSVPIRRTGVPADGGQTCATGCHASFGAANSDARGSIRIETQNYRPGVRQTILVSVAHPEGRRWGFQLTARLANDERRQAGTFNSTSQVRVWCDPSGEAPCNGGVEFATHRPESTQDSIPERGAWAVEWTAPGDDVGDIALYAAGVAAGHPLNSDEGDRVYTTRLVLSNEGACSLPRPPQLRTLVNGASFRPGGSANAMVSLLGMDFQVGGIKRGITLSDFVDGRFPTMLGCVAVEIGGRRAPLVYVQTDQINAQAPAVTPPGPLPVRVILNPGLPNELRSDVATITFAEFSPAFFMFLPSTSIAAVFGGANIPVADPSVHPAGRPARSGDIISLYGTGFGPTEPAYEDGEIPPANAVLREPYRITIGGVTLAASDILYAGLAPQSISGLYQFNVRVPAGVGPGDVPVSIEIGGVRTAEPATIPVRSE